MDQTIDRRSFLATSAALCASLGLGGLAFSRQARADESAPADASADAEAPENAEAEVDAVSGASIFLFRNYAAAHGDKCFAQVGVAVTSDYVIRAVNIDEYQYLTAGEGVVGVPNSKGAFGESFPEGKVLASKRTNNEFYSKMLAEEAGSTQSWLTSIEAIEQFAIGKTVDEVADIAQQGIDGQIGIDTISGATLVDAFGYLKAVAETVRGKDDPLQMECAGSYTGDVEGLTIGTENAAAHGDKSFTNALALVQADGTVAASLIDDFQFMDASGEVTGVPNSDGGLGENFPEGKVLGSKMLNDETYSAHMAEAGGATQSWKTSASAIEAYAIGKQAGELINVAVDAVSGATFADTTGYAGTIAIATAAAGK